MLVSKTELGASDLTRVRLEAERVVDYWWAKFQSRVEQPAALLRGAAVDSEEFAQRLRTAARAVFQNTGED